MKFNIATKLALILSLILSIFASIVLYVVDSQLDIIILFGLVIFVMSFTFLKYSLQYYVTRQIKSIYNIINEGEVTDANAKSLIKIEQDVLVAQQEKKQNLYDLQEQNNYRKEFIGNLSHELKTPLFSIQGYVETLIDGGIYDENINMAYLKKASNNIDRLSAIVHDVDTIASVESGTMNLEKSVFNINDLIRESIDSLELLADKNDVNISLEEDSKTFKVLADKEKISRVLINLISNSVKYAKEGGNTILKLKKIADKVLIEVVDDGIGIKEEQVPRVFERFYRVDSNRSREQGGSGLGLAIVKHIVEAHQESIRVSSVFGQGTTFSFTLSIA